MWIKNVNFKGEAYRVVIRRRIFGTRVTLYNKYGLFSLHEENFDIRAHTTTDYIDMIKITLIAYESAYECDIEEHKAWKGLKEWNGEIDL